MGVTQRRVRIDGGAWEVLTVATTKTFTGLTASSSHTIDAQAGDAAGNWSTSTSWSGSTAAPAVTATSPTDLAGLYYYCLLYTSPSPRDRTRYRMPSSA